eukprot:s312_g10.t1
MAGEKVDMRETVVDLTLETPKKTRSKTSVDRFDENMGKEGGPAVAPLYFTPDRPTKALRSPAATFKDKTKTEGTGSPGTSSLVCAMQSLDLDMKGSRLSMPEGWKGPQLEDTPEIGTSVWAHRPSPVGLDWCGVGNFDHGAYKSGDKLEAKRDSFELFLSAQDPSYFETFQEAIAADRGQPFSGHCDFDSVSDVMSDWMNSKALRNRGLYVTLLNE